MRPETCATVVVLRGDEEVAAWPLSAAAVDLAVVEALARLRLRAARAGLTVRVREPSRELAGLLELVGLRGTLAPDG